MTRTSKRKSLSSPISVLKDKRDSEIEELKRVVTALNKRVERSYMISVIIVFALAGVLLFGFLILDLCCNFDLHTTQIKQLSTLHKQQMKSIETLLEGLGKGIMILDRKVDIKVQSLHWRMNDRMEEIKSLSKNLNGHILFYDDELEQIRNRYARTVSRLNSHMEQICKLQKELDRLKKSNSIPFPNKKATRPGYCPCFACAINATEAVADPLGPLGKLNADSVKEKKPLKNSSCFEWDHKSLIDEYKWLLYDIYRPIVVFFCMFLKLMIYACFDFIQYLLREINRASSEGMLFLRTLERWDVLKK